MELILLSKADKDILHNCRNIAFGDYLGKGQTSWDGEQQQKAGQMG